MRGIGYFLGATLGAALLFFIISYIFFKPTEVSNKQISKFINDFNKIIIKNPIPFLSMYDGDDKRLGGDEISKMTYFSNHNMSYIRADTYTYFCTELNYLFKNKIFSTSLSLLSG